MTTLSPVPDYAKVPKDEYRHWRNECQITARAAGYDWMVLWNFAVAEVMKRHENVSKGRAKNELSLGDAVRKVQKEAVKARMDAEMERRQTA